jgi:hypothetical protein
MAFPGPPPRGLFFIGIVAHSMFVDRQRALPSGKDQDAIDFQSACTSGPFLSMPALASEFTIASSKKNGSSRYAQCDKSSRDNDD